MTVKQLIKELQTHAPDNEVKIEVQYKDAQVDRDNPVSKISFRDGGVIISIEVPRTAGKHS